MGVTVCRWVLAVCATAVALAIAIGAATPWDDLQAPAAEQRIAAARIILSERGAPPPGTTHALVTALADPYHEVRRAAESLGRMGPLAAAALPALALAAKDAEAAVAEAAAAAAKAVAENSAGGR